MPETRCCQWCRRKADARNPRLPAQAGQLRNGTNQFGTEQLGTTVRRAESNDGITMASLSFDLLDNRAYN